MPQESITTLLRPVSGVACFGAVDAVLERRLLPLETREAREAAKDDDDLILEGNKLTKLDFLVNFGEASERRTDRDPSPSSCSESRFDPNDVETF